MIDDDRHNSEARENQNKPRNADGDILWLEESRNYRDKPENYPNDVLWKKYWDLIDKGEDSKPVKNEIEEELWKNYFDAKKSSNNKKMHLYRNDLLTWYVAYDNSFVQVIARKMVRYDLYRQHKLSILNSVIAPPGEYYGKSKGSKSLIQAIERFDPAQGVPFAAYAVRYIQGAIRQDINLILHGTISRTAINHDVDEELSEQPKRPQTAENLRNAKGLANPEYQNEFQRYEDYEIEFQSDEDVEGEVEKQLSLEESLQAIQKLDEMSQKVIHYYYLEERSHQEISKLLNITVENCRQILSRSMKKVRNMFIDERKA